MKCGVYLGAGILANLAQYAITPMSDVPVIGASGAVAGVMGTSLRYTPKRASISFDFILFFKIFTLRAWIVLEFGLRCNFWAAGSDPETIGVAYWAHISGFVAGICDISTLARERIPRILACNRWCTLYPEATYNHTISGSKNTAQAPPLISCAGFLQMPQTALRLQRRHRLFPLGLYLASDLQPMRPPLSRSAGQQPYPRFTGHVPEPVIACAATYAKSNDAAPKRRTPTQAGIGLAKSCSVSGRSPAPRKRNTSCIKTIFDTITGGYTNAHFVHHARLATATNISSLVGS